MAIAEYPLPSVNSSYPDPLVTYKLPNEYQTAFTQYDDGGRDFALQHGGVGTQRWYLFYDGITAAEAAVLDSWVETAKLGDGGFSAYAGNFRDPDTGTLYSNVRVQSYDRPVHKNKDVQTRTVILVRFP